MKRLDPAHLAKWQQARKEAASAFINRRIGEGDIRAMLANLGYRSDALNAEIAEIRSCREEGRPYL